MNRQKRADMMLVLATGFWGISNCLIAICLRDMQPVTLNAFRFLSAFAVLGTVFHTRVLRASRETLKYSVYIGLSLVAIYLGATYGILYTSVSNAGFIGAMTVVVTPAFEFALYRRRPEKKFGFALVLCVIGIALMTLNEALRPALGDVICLLVPAFYAVDLMVTEKAVAEPEVDPIALGVLQTAVAGAVMFVLSRLLETPSLPGSPKVWAAALFLGVFCSGICFVIQSVEQQFTTASHASLIFTLEPVFSAVFAYFLLSERLTARGYFGAALMLASLLIMELDLSVLRGRSAAHDDV